MNAVNVAADAGRQHAAGRDELDRGGAAADLLADGLPERVDAVDLPREPDAVPVAARHGERAPSGDDPRPGEQAALHRAGELGDAEAAEVADGRDARGEMALRVHRALDRAEGSVELAPFRGEVARAVEAQMDVAVDQPGRERAAGAVDVVVGLLRGARRPRVRTDPADPVAVDEHAVLGPDAASVEQRDVRDVGRGHAQLTQGGTVSEPSSRISFVPASIVTDDRGAVLAGHEVVPCADRHDHGVAHRHHRGLVVDVDRAGPALDREHVEVVVVVPREPSARRHGDPEQRRLVGAERSRPGS